MKKLATSFVFALGLSFISFGSFATGGEKKSNSSVSENPWEVFKEVVYTYKTSNVDFMYKSEAEQAAFLSAAAEMKEKISEYPDYKAEEKIKRINSAITIFTFIWDIKNDIQLTEQELFPFELPKVE